MSEETLDNIVVLTDDEGKDARFEFLGEVDLLEKKYIVLTPEEDEEGTVMILQEAETDDENEPESFITIEDDQLVDQVFNIFKETYADDYEFVD